MDETKVRGRPFQKGKSGNPGGRPKKSEHQKRIEDAAKEYSEEALQALADEAKNGTGASRVNAAIALLDRAWGRPVERQESGEAGAFDAKNMTDEQLAAEKKELLELAVKSGDVKLLPSKKSGG